ncbi:MAG: SRPBCC domain-containing protein [Burkholderiales bacterium]|nr:SRPBCC domain-containing protein [Burkholderiales bacterium]
MVESSEPTGAKHSTSAERKSDLEVIVRRSFDAPARLVFEAWTRPELFRPWWVPKSSGLTLLSLDQDVRVGGAYRLVFDLGDSKTMTFFGTYIEVTPPSRLSWTNEESDDGAVTTVTFEEQDGQTHLTFSERYRTKEALDRNIGSTEGLPEQFAQLDALLSTLV